MRKKVKKVAKNLFDNQNITQLIAIQAPESLQPLESSLNYEKPLDLKKLKFIVVFWTKTLKKHWVNDLNSIIFKYLEINIYFLKNKKSLHNCIVNKNTLITNLQPKNNGIYGWAILNFCIDTRTKKYKKCVFLIYEHVIAS